MEDEGFGLAQIKRQGDVILCEGGEDNPEERREIYVSKSELYKMFENAMRATMHMTGDIEYFADAFWDEMESKP